MRHSITDDEFVRYVKRFGPVNTPTIQRVFGISTSNNITKRLHAIKDLKCDRSYKSLSPKSLMWSYIPQVESD